MEETCPVSTKSQHILHDVQSSSTCNTMLKSLRNVQCVNKPGSGLLKAFVNDLECGWESSASSVWNEHYVLHTFSVILTSWLGLIYGY
jgi:GH15 family glucan-1,4-alpha-glucosidase